MKLLHVGDLHLGKSLLNYDLIEDQEYILEQVLEIIKRENVDALLVAGDVYDKSIPSEAATRLLDKFLISLSHMEVKTYMISGNHDSDERLNYARTFMESHGIYISSVYDGELKKYVLKTESENDPDEVDIYMLPFVKASQVRHFYPKANINNYEDAVRVIIENTEIDESKCNIMIAHQYVTGCNGSVELAGSESNATKNVGFVEQIGYECFDKFDYVALGHIHTPQKVGRETVRYSGSPLKYSLSEIWKDKSVPLITINDKSDIQIDLIPLKPKREFRQLNGKMKELLKEENITDTDDYIYVKLTDDEIINDAIGIFRKTYPNTLKLIYDNDHTKTIEDVDISEITENRSFEDLISDFYINVYGSEITDEEMKIMREIAGEVGIINEADQT
ncbi:MAG: exonuclease SbcCD subunit D [Lachnospiraceae bacterium]|nr:exonuclease SbcCD subunit D [Lachnospiraceae bacterium]